MKTPKGQWNTMDLPADFFPADPGRHIVGLYGAGGFAREVMPLLRRQIQAWSRSTGKTMPTLCFIETDPRRPEVNGLPVLSEDQFFEIDVDQRFFNVAIGDSRARQRIAERCLARGALALSIASDRALCDDGNQIGAGAILCANTTVTSNATIGDFFHANIYSYVAHDCVIGHHVTFAPAVRCNGNVHIHDHAYIGTGAILKQGSADKPLVIGEGAIVGMGAVVTRDVAPHTTVVGNPAKILVRN